VRCSPAPRECGQTLDVPATATGSLTQASQLAGAVVKNHLPVSCHFKADIPPGEAVDNSSVEGAQRPVTVT
jgi:hypothetical protein